MKQIYTIVEAAKELGMTPKQLSNIFDRGMIRGYRIPGTQERRIPVQSLMKYAEDFNIQIKVEN